MTENDSTNSRNEKRFTYNVKKNTIECDGKFVAYVNSVDGIRIANKLSVLSHENEQLKKQKPFLKIHEDYFIQYGDDNELFNLHKPSDIRSLVYLINRENGYDELECEYNEEGYGND